jgi:hypothetical protein
MQFRITRQYARGSEIAFAEFDDMNDAKLFIEAKLAHDASLKTSVIYRLYKGPQEVETYNPSESDNSPGRTSASQGVGTSTTAGSTSTSGFRPTPFNMTPRPAGSPQKWVSDKDDDEKKK